MTWRLRLRWTAGSSSRYQTPWSWWRRWAPPQRGGHPCLKIKFSIKTFFLSNWLHYFTDTTILLLQSHRCLIQQFNLEGSNVQLPPPRPCTNTQQVNEPVIASFVAAMGHLNCPKSWPTIIEMNPRFMGWAQCNNKLLLKGFWIWSSTNSNSTLFIQT